MGNRVTERRAPGARGSLLAAAAVGDLNATSELISHEAFDEVADIGRP